MTPFDNIEDPLDPNGQTGAATTPSTSASAGLRDGVTAFATAFGQHASAAGGQAEGEDQAAEDNPTPAEHYGSTLDTVAGGMRVNDATRYGGQIVSGFSGRAGGDPLGYTAMLPTHQLPVPGTRPLGTHSQFGPGPDGAPIVSPGSTPATTSVDF